MDISTGLNHGSEAASVPLEMKAAAFATGGDGGAAKSVSEAAKPRGVLDGPSLVVTEETAEAFQAMAQSSYETKMNTIKNMVDTPEERQAKAEREAREQAKADEAKFRQADLDEKDFQEKRILDEIAAKRVITDGLV